MLIYDWRHVNTLKYIKIIFLSRKIFNDLKIDNSEKIFLNKFQV